MKKISIFFVIIIAILSSIWYLYNSEKISERNRSEYNSYLENHLNKEISGSDLATLINKSINQNEKNDVLKDGNGIYFDNDTNSISIEIKFKDNDSIIKGELISKNGTERFVELYGNAQFKLTKLEYHKQTKIVKYAYFEEV